MKIEELSIGDWVRLKSLNLDCKIIGCGIRIEIENSILTLQSEIACVQIGEMDDLTVYIDKLEPIPLTPEILEKNGFERKQYTIDIVDGQEIEYDGYRHILCQDGVQYDIILGDSCGGYFDLEIESSSRNEAGERILISSRLSLDYVEFVHQLQHALRLAGIEKEIEV